MIEVSLTYVLGIFLIICVVVWRKFRDEKLLYENLPPGSLGLPLIGESVSFVVKKIGFFTEKHAKYGRVFKTHLFGNPTIRVYGADNLRQIILGEGKYVQSSYPTSVQKLLGTQSIAMSHGYEHKYKKTQLMKYLCPEFLRSHIPVLATTISEKLQTWRDQPFIDVYKECRSLFIGLAAKYLIHIDISDDEVDEIREQLEIMMSNMFCLPFNFPGFGFHKALKAKQKLRDMLKKALSKPSSCNNNWDEPCSVLEGLCGSTSDENDLRDEETFLDPIIELLFSSTETVSSAGFALCYELMKKSGAMQTLHSEIAEYDLQNPNDMVSPQDLQEMKYVDSVVKETLRATPPAGGAYRVATRTFELDGYTIPKGWSIVYSIRDTHHNDDSITKPREFHPDRWLENEFGPDKYAYLPFGAGARICPGQAYAKTILKLFTVEFARTCSGHIVNDSDIQLWPSPRPATQVLAEIRNKNNYMSS